MPDFEKYPDHNADVNALRDEEAYGGFDTSDDATFGEALHTTPSVAVPLEHAAYVPSAPQQMVQDVLIDDVFVPDSFNTSSEKTSESFTDAMDAEIIPATAKTVTTSGDAVLAGAVTGAMAFGGASDQTFGTGSAPDGAGSTAGNSSAGQSFSGQTDAERLRFGFDEAKPSNQRVPPPMKKSWFANNGMALAVTAGISLLSGGVAAYFLSSQSQSAQTFFNKFIGKDSSANASKLVDTTSSGTPPNLDNGANAGTVNPPDNTQTLASASKNTVANDGANAAVNSVNTADTAQEALRRTDSLQAALQQRMGGAQVAKNKGQETESKGQEITTNTKANAQANTQANTKTEAENKVAKLAAENSRPKISGQAIKPQTAKQLNNPATKPKATKQVTGLYAVQVHSTTSPLEAERVRRQLEIRGLPTPKVVTADLGMRFLYRVRFGNYATQRDAERAADRTGYAETWIVKLH
jgi:hypothetical protein